MIECMREECCKRFSEKSGVLIAPECRNCSCSCGFHDGVQIPCVVWCVEVRKKLTRVLFAGFAKGLCIFEIRPDAFLKSTIAWISKNFGGSSQICHTGGLVRKAGQQRSGLTNTAYIPADDFVTFQFWNPKTRTEFKHKICCGAAQAGLEVQGM